LGLPQAQSGWLFDSFPKAIATLAARLTVLHAGLQRAVRQQGWHPAAVQLTRLSHPVRADCQAAIFVAMVAYITT
jgi:hypothetical protein